MERKQLDRSSARMLTALSAFLLGCAAVWDLLRAARRTLPPNVSYVLMGVAVAVASAGVLLRLLSRRFLLPSHHPLGPQTPGVRPPPISQRRDRLRNFAELLVTGLVLLGWWVRGDPGIPADPPVVAVELLGALVLAGSAASARRRAMVSDPRVR